jgi:hypothetical protein
MTTSANELPPPDGCCKVIIQHHRNERGDIVATVFGRDDTGLLIGCVQGQSGKFGIGAGVQEWFFLDSDRAELYIKELCREYLGRRDVDFVHQNADKLVQAAPQMPQQRRM